MQKALFQFLRMRAFRPVLGVSLAVLVGWLALLAVSEELHESWHHDAGQANHECAITLFSHGKLTSTSVPLPVISIRPLELLLEVSFVSAVFVSFRYLLRPGRAPPVLC